VLATSRIGLQLRTFSYLDAFRSQSSEIQTHAYLVVVIATPIVLDIT
jgi:hypothetical protein